MSTARETRHGHTQGHVRNAIVEALDEWSAGAIKHWADHFESRDQAREILGKLWRSTDTVPSATRSDAANLLDCEEAAVSSFARLVQGLKATLVEPAASST